MHRDRFRGEGRPDRLVSTYLALGRGRKHVILLPPTDEGARVAEVRYVYVLRRARRPSGEPLCAYYTLLTF
eukprot:6457063-Prymnesium_polylepis.2